MATAVKVKRNSRAKSSPKIVHRKLVAIAREFETAIEAMSDVELGFAENEVLSYTSLNIWFVLYELRVALLERIRDVKADRSQPKETL